MILREYSAYFGCVIMRSDTLTLMRSRFDYKPFKRKRVVGKNVARLLRAREKNERSRGSEE